MTGEVDPDAFSEWLTSIRALETIDAEVIDDAELARRGLRAPRATLVMHGRGSAPDHTLSMGGSDMGTSKAMPAVLQLLWRSVFRTNPWSFRGEQSAHQGWKADVLTLSSVTYSMFAVACQRVGPRSGCLAPPNGERCPWMIHGVWRLI